MPIRIVIGAVMLFLMSMIGGVMRRRRGGAGVVRWWRSQRVKR